MQGTADAGPEGLLADLSVPIGEALREGDARRAELLARALLAGGLDLVHFYERVLTPLLEGVGVQWREGGISIAEEHVCTTAVRTVIDRLGSQPLPEPTRGRVVLVAGPEEQHIIGLLMLRHVLRSQGWLVSLPDPMPHPDLVEYVARLEDARLLGVSLHRCPRPQYLGTMIAHFREGVSGIPVVLGGRAVREDPGLWQRSGADGGAVDLVGGLSLVNSLTNPLTRRESEVLRLASNGRTNKEIAEELGVKTSTIKTHLERIYLKTGVVDRTASVALALRQGWIS